MWTRVVKIWGIDMLWGIFELPESDLSVAKTKQTLEGPKVDVVSIFEYPCSRFDFKQHDTEASLTKKSKQRSQKHFCLKRTKKTGS